MNEEVVDYAALAGPLDHLVREAARAILAIYSKPDFAVTRKDDASPLTKADLASHEILVRGLQEMSPILPVLSEEGASKRHADDRRQWTRYWLVDPLDGTKEFLKRNGEFTINVALVEFGRPAVGIVHVPVSGTSYFGIPGGQALRGDRNGDWRPVRVAGARPGQPIRIVGSRSHAGGELERFTGALGAHEFVAMGSALKFCLIAEGGADVYLRLKPTSEWDTAAGQAVVEAAGGSVTDLDGIPLRYNCRDTLINPSFLASGDLSRDYTEAARSSSPR